MDQATHNKIVSFIWGIADDVRPHTPDARGRDGAAKSIYDFSITMHCNKSPALRTLEEIRAYIIDFEKEAEGLPDAIFEGAR